MALVEGKTPLVGAVVVGAACTHLAPLLDQILPLQPCAVAVPERRLAVWLASASAVAVAVSVVVAVAAVVAVSVVAVPGSSGPGSASAGPTEPPSLPTPLGLRQHQEHISNVHTFCTCTNYTYTTQVTCRKNLKLACLLIFIN